jgi:thiol-disulfide isomerase/thioredoxin
MPKPIDGSRRSAVFVLLVLLALPGPSCALGIGDPAPDWRLSTPSGEVVRFGVDGRDRVAVVLFWATWCPYCRTLMPHIQKLADEFRDQPVRFYALDVWEDGDPVAHLRERGYTFTLLLAAEPVAEAWGVAGTPGLFVVDRSGIVRYRRASGAGDDDVERAARDAITAALVEARRPPQP